MSRCLCDWHAIEIDWQAESSEAANDGTLTFWLDGVQIDQLTGMDFSHIDYAQLGPVQGLDATTSGTYYFDAFESRRESYIGPIMTDPTPTPSTQTPTSAATPSPTVTGTLTATPADTPTSTPSDLIFADGFEDGDLSAWTSHVNDSGDLSASTAAAYEGTYGLQAVIDDTHVIYVKDETPDADTSYHVRFYFDPNSLTMAEGDEFKVFEAMGLNPSHALLQIRLRYSGGQYQIQAYARHQDWSWDGTSWVTLTDDWHAIEAEWQAASSDTASDGLVSFWLDGNQVGQVNGLDTSYIDDAYLGAVRQIDAGTQGTIYFDSFASRRESYIGPLAASSQGQAVAAMAVESSEMVLASPPLPTSTASGFTRPLKKAVVTHMAKLVTAQAVDTTAAETTNSVTAQTSGEIVIRRMTYSLAGQAIAVRVTGDPDPANKACPEPVEGACFTCTTTMLRRCSAQAWAAPAR